MLKITNTLGRQKQEFTPLEEGKVRFYHCGPTVYWTQHIGNMRAMTMGDVIRRSLEYMGYQVEYVRNYTDFGHLSGDNEGDADTGVDRMTKGAKREGTTPEAIADKYIAQFEHDVAALNIKDPSTKTRATNYIDEMITMVQELLDKGYAYTTPEAIYYDISKFETYTELSGRKLDTNIVGAGHGKVTETSKKNPEDFALWFFKTGAHKHALQYWESPFESPEVANGEGIPGWHVECSAMARAVLGPQLDIHMGGVEHISIHHPNEIAQSEAANDVKYVNYWIHNEHLTVDGGKMSKSEGTSFTLQDVTDKGYDPIVLRYFFLQAHYRSKQNFTWEALEASQTALKRLVKLAIPSDFGQGKPYDKYIEEGKTSEEHQQKFIEAIEDDFNIPKALSVMWEVAELDINETDRLATMNSFDLVLGLGLEALVVAFAQESAVIVTDEMKKVIDKRQEARANKDWETSDKLRDELRQKFGVEIMDEGDDYQLRRRV